MLKRLQPLIFGGNCLLLLVLIFTRLGHAVDIAITGVIILGSGLSLWSDWQENRRDRRALEAMQREARPVIDRHVEAAILDDRGRSSPEHALPSAIHMMDARGNRLEVVVYRRYSKPLGDPTCRYSANSAVLRCAVNPSGPCDSCTHYQLPDDVLAWVALEAKLQKAARKLGISYEEAFARFSNSFAPDPELEAAIQETEQD